MEEKLKGSIYITTKDIQTLNGGSLRQAQREFLMVKDVLGIKGNKLTVRAYCDYWEVSYDTVVKHINPFR